MTKTTLVQELAPAAPLAPNDVMPIGQGATALKNVGLAALADFIGARLGGGGTTPGIPGIVSMSRFLSSPRTPGVTDDTAAFTAAEAFAATHGCKIQLEGTEIGKGATYYLPNGFNAHRNVNWEGVGSGQGGVGANTVILVGKNANGWVWNKGNTHGDGLGTQGDTSGGSLSGVVLWGGNVNVNPATGIPTTFGAGDSPNGHGVRIRSTFIFMADVCVACFGGDAFNIICSAGSGGFAEGNANNWRMDHCSALYCGGSGLLIAGLDSNAGSTENFSAISCGGAGIKDYSFLGNTHSQPHIRDCGNLDPVHVGAPVGACMYGGLPWYVVAGREAQATNEQPGSVTNGTEAWRRSPGYANVDWAPGKTWTSAAPYQTNPGNLNARNVFVGAYAESGQAPCQATAPTIFIGGLLDEVGFDKNSNAVWLRPSINGDLMVPSLMAWKPGTPLSTAGTDSLALVAQNRAWDGAAGDLSDAAGSLHFVSSSENGKGPAITFGHTGEGGAKAGAGIYTISDGGYGTRLFIGTTNSFGGVKPAIGIDEFGNVNVMRGKLKKGGVSITAAEWAPNFTGAGDAYIPAVEAMTIGEGAAHIGTGTLTYAKSTAADPSTFTDTALPAALEAGAWLRVRAADVTGFVAAHLKRTA